MSRPKLRHCQAKTESGERCNRRVTTPLQHSVAFVTQHGGAGRALCDVHRAEFIAAVVKTVVLDPTRCQTISIWALRQCQCLPIEGGLCRVHVQQIRPSAQVQAVLDDLDRLVSRR